MPFKRIAKELSASVATIHSWTRDIELTPEQHQRNLVGPGGPANPEDVRRRAYSWSRRCRNRRLEHQRAGRNRAMEGDPLHMAGCMLYWAEGSKAKNKVQFTNSDLPMTRLFRAFMTECFDVTPERFRLSLNVYLDNGLEIAEIEEHWLRGLSLPSSALRKHQFNHLPTSSSGKKRNRLPYGVCTLRVVQGTEIVQHIFGAVQEYAGFTCPELAG